MHYTTNGTAGTDRSKVGLIYAKEPPKREICATAVLQRPVSRSRLAPTTSRWTPTSAFVQDATVWGDSAAHAPARQELEIRLELPDGTAKTILSVPKYDFNWQTYYMFDEPIEIPKGSKLISSAQRQLGEEQVQSGSEGVCGAIRRGRRCSTRGCCSARQPIADEDRRRRSAAHRPGGGRGHFP